MHQLNQEIPDSSILLWRRQVYQGKSVLDAGHESRHSVLQVVELFRECTLSLFCLKLRRRILRLTTTYYLRPEASFWVNSMFKATKRKVVAVRRSWAPRRRSESVKKVW